jgi:hypothetical protein
MFTRTLKVAATCGALLLGLAASASSHGWSNSIHRDYITFSGTVSLPGVMLPAGTYRFEVPDVALSSGLVSVSSRDGRKVYLTQFTRIVDRPRDRDSLNVMLGEAAPGTAPQVKAWFPIGESTGRQFIYN